MLFLVFREVEGSRSEWAIFTDLDGATECYDEAAYVVRNAPGEGPEDDPTIVTAASLYAAYTADPETALEMVSGGRAVLMESE